MDGIAIRLQVSNGIPIQVRAAKIVCAWRREGDREIERASYVLLVGKCAALFPPIEDRVGQRPSAPRALALFMRWTYPRDHSDYSESAAD